MTKKYREVADPAESDVVHDWPAGLPTAAVSTNPKQTCSVARLKEDIRVNRRKIRWDVERYSLSEYREKLQAHPDAISIVLSTFLWCVLYLSPILRTKQTLGPRPTASRPTGKPYREDAGATETSTTVKQTFVTASPGSPQHASRLQNQSIPVTGGPTEAPTALQETEQNGGITSTIAPGHCITEITI